MRRLALVALIPLFAFANGKIAGVVAFTGRAAKLPKPRVTELACADAGVIDQSVQLADGGKALANVVVRVDGVFDGGSAAVSVSRCAFVPHLSIAATGATLVLENRDAVLHDVHAVARVDGKDRNVFTVALPPGTRAERVARAEVLKLSCDLHPWETSYLVLSSGPAAVSDGDGAFELSVPAGRYTVEAWHERYGRRSATVTVEEGASVDPKLSFSDHP